MPPHLVLDVLCCLVSLFAGGAITWRLLGRNRRGYFRKLAQELTDGVHERCSSYKRLEDRIDAVIAEFDQREFDLRNEFADGMLAVEEPVFPTAEFAATDLPEAEAPAADVSAAPEAAAESDALSWMDSCDAPGDPIADVAQETSFVGLPVAEERVEQRIEPRIEDDGQTVVDRFAQSLQILQREKSDELERQRGWIGTLEGRIQALESSMRELAQRGASAVESPAAPNAESAIWAQQLQAVYDRIARSEQELAAWHAHHEGLARERIATIESARAVAEDIRAGLQRNPEAEASASSVRARAEELARDIVKLQATIARREDNAPRSVPAAPQVAPVAPVAQGQAVRPPTIEARAPRPVAPEAAPTAPQETPIAKAEVARPAISVDDLPGLVDTTLGKAPAIGAPPREGPSEIAQLMRSLEIARGEADTYRRKLHEQNSQFTAAYAMLDRIRPFVEALESDYAAHGREGGKP